jgi:hypothetical protein
MVFVMFVVVSVVEGPAVVVVLLRRRGGGCGFERGDQGHGEAQGGHALEEGAASVVGIVDGLVAHLLLLSVIG